MHMIPVFLTSDENYVKYMSVTIQSITAGTSHHINFYILDGGITKASKEKIKNQLAGTNHTIEFIDIDLSLFNGFPDIAHFSLNTYFRYLIPTLKPELDKVLYLDTDMVICGDIAEIYNQDMTGYGIGAVAYMDEDYKPDLYKKHKELLNISQNHRYFNAGLLLIDCNYWRKNNTSTVLFSKTAALKEIIKMPDQDVLNIVFENNYKELKPQYNLVVDLTAKYTDFNKYINSLNGCYVLHYTGGKGIRPWLRKNVPGEKHFWENAKSLSVYHELLTELSKNQTNSLNEKTDKTFKVKIDKLFGLLPFFKTTRKKNK